MKIGDYQLQNLLRNQVKFLYLDVSQLPVPHPLLKEAIVVAANHAVEYALANTPDRNYPIVVICENGEKSLEVGGVLEENSFLNVYVVEGGSQSLPS